MDRNGLLALTVAASLAVALCEEGVDRNPFTGVDHQIAVVALCEEGVDRNMSLPSSSLPYARSPSAKRAWIEISRKSSGITLIWSPSAKRAWIEIKI